MFLFTKNLDDYDIEPAPDSLAKKIHLDTIIPKVHACTVHVKLSDESILYIDT